MSITLTYEMFSRLSDSARDEILKTFVQGVKDVLIPPKQTSAFESAALTFSGPLILPNYNREPENDVMSEPLKQTRTASNFPIAKATDLYSTAHYSVIHKICQEIDEGLFLSNSKSVDWSEGSRYHHKNWDVMRVVMTVNQLKPATSLQIDQALPTMDRYRVSAILRELRKQGIVLVN